MPPGRSSDPVTIRSTHRSHSTRTPSGAIGAPVPHMTATRPRMGAQVVDQRVERGDVDPGCGRGARRP